MHFSTFYSSFFEELLVNNIPYSIARNYESLPMSKQSGDVDMLVEENDMESVLEILNNALEKVGGKFKITSKRWYVVKLKLLNVYDDVTGEQFTELDLITKLAWKGMNWLSISEVLRNSDLNQNSLFVPCPEHELQMTLFHSLLYGGFVKRKYCDNITKLMQDVDLFCLQEELAYYFDQDIANFVVNSLKSEKWKELEENVYSIRNALILKSFKMGRLKSVAGLFGHYYLELIVRFKEMAKY